jgi:hypothetical protein
MAGIAGHAAITGGQAAITGPQRAVTTTGADQLLAAIGGAA